MNQPNNEVIISEIAQAEQYLRKSLLTLIEANATHHTLRGFVDALSSLSISYSQERALVSMECGNQLRPFAVTATVANLQPEAIEQLKSELQSFTGELKQWD
jgi:hypothetical protein